jgi:hypothetical protein
MRVFQANWKVRRLNAVLWLVVFMGWPRLVNAQLWSGIVDTSRAINWTQAGVVGGIPSANWTQCGSTIAAGSSASTIQSAINSCASNHYVLLAAGTFNLSTGLVMKSNVALRGAGANQTFLVFTGSVGCFSGGATVCFTGDGSYEGSPQVQPGGSQAATWSGGYSQGATQITLSNVGSNGLNNGQFIFLDQANVASDNGNFFVCHTQTLPCSLEGGPPGRVIGGIIHSQVQVVQVTAGCSVACTGAGPFTVTISPGLYSPNWSGSSSPGVWWLSMVQYAGLENLSINTSGGSEENIGVFNAYNCWVTGVRSVSSQRAHVWIVDAAHTTIQNNYFYGTLNAQSQSYGIEQDLTSDNLITNNITQHVTTPYMFGNGLGNVMSYNYTIYDFYGVTPTFLIQAANTGHDAGAEYNLYEGNIMSGLAGDDFHGTSGFNTAFRNALPGWEVGINNDETAVIFGPYNRYENIVGNVLGMPGIQSSYSGNSNNSIYDLGAGNSEHGITVPPDPEVATTMLRWGNYDSVHAATQFNTAEVPSGISSYGNAVPASQTLPPSFYLSAPPAIWPAFSKPWPPIGPDVTGGNVGQCTSGTFNHAFALSSSQCAGGTFTPSVQAGHVNTIPAMDCYLNTMHGPLDGSGSALSFNASQCYGSTATELVLPPTGLVVTVN